MREADTAARRQASESDIFRIQVPCTLRRVPRDELPATVCQAVVRICGWEKAAGGGPFRRSETRLCAGFASFRHPSCALPNGAQWVRGVAVLKPAQPFAERSEENCCDKVGGGAGIAAMSIAAEEIIELPEGGVSCRSRPAISERFPGQ